MPLCILCTRLTRTHQPPLRGMCGILELCGSLHCASTIVSSRHVFGVTPVDMYGILLFNSKLSEPCAPLPPRGDTAPLGFWGCTVVSPIFVLERVRCKPVHLDGKKNHGIHPAWYCRAMKKVLNVGRLDCPPSPNPPTPPSS